METMLLPYAHSLVPARFLARHKRFTVEVELEAEMEAGRRELAHTNNTGAMLGLLRPGGRVWLSRAANPKRKLGWTLELSEFHSTLVGVNTAIPLRLLQAAIRAGKLPEAGADRGLRREVAVGASRLDARLDGPDGPIWVECKNVTLVEDGGQAQFPDAPTQRGRKHLRELMDLARSGQRAALFFCIQRGDADCFAPAGAVDPEYEELFYQALENGVEAWPYVAEVTTAGIGLGDRLPVRMPGSWVAGQAADRGGVPMTGVLS